MLLILNLIHNNVNLNNLVIKKIIFDKSGLIPTVKHPVYGDFLLNRRM